MLSSSRPKGCVLGHLSKTCKKRMVCRQCSQRHPDILHEEKDTTKTSAVTRKDDSALTEEVAGAQKSVAQEIVGCNGAESQSVC